MPVSQDMNNVAANADDPRINGCMESVFSLKINFICSCDKNSS